MSYREQSYEQFIRNYKENNFVQSYYKTRHLSNKLLEEQLIGFCPIFSRYEFPLLRGRLIVPIYDVHDNLLALAGRQIPELKDQVYNAFWEVFGHEPAKCQDRINKWVKGKWLNEPYQRNKNLFFLNKAIITSTVTKKPKGMLDAVCWTFVCRLCIKSKYFQMNLNKIS